MPLRFIFAVHNHQPVGNFGHVFEEAYRLSYWPFLELLEQYPDVPFCLHTSGPLMEWLVEHRPEYIDRLRNLVARGQVEILGGGFYEPILPMLPARDRVGQIRTYTHYLENLFPTRIRGMWVPERVWEQNLVGDIVAAGIEYTVLDDYHFRQAGLDEHQLFGYYLTEDDGKLLRVFPGSERIRYLVPFRDPPESIHYFGEVASKNPDAVVVFADDGEKFGSWPETHRHCYTNGWLRWFLDTLRQNRHWVRPCTFSQALDETPPVGTIYLPDSSYREMTEWALPAQRLLGYNGIVRELDQHQRGQEIKRFLRAGFWRNFKAKYPETREMYARMLQVSRRVQQADEADPGSAVQARQELYRAQCNCPWWHGAFGGLYLPHLRNAVYEHLIAAENALLEAENRSEDWIEAETGDLNLDGFPDVCLSNGRLAAYFNPRAGGSLYELDLRFIRHNLLATLSRRPESYHETIRRHAGGGGHHGGDGLHERVVFKQSGLDRLLQYDAYLRKSLIDHFYEPGTTLEQVASNREVELGDFVTGPYEHQVVTGDNEVRLLLRRSGNVSGQAVRVTKEVRLAASSDALEVRYTLENLPRDRRLLFAVECNFAGMAAGADDRYFYHEGSPRAGQLQTLQDLNDANRIGLVDEWRGLDASLALSLRGGIWAFPIQTVSQSEGGFELVHQSTAVLPHWHVEPDGQGRWEVTLWMKLDVSRAVERMLAASGATG
ncbi:MAG TPA: alpha-amylase/4-alpha-glucanotransferase domain-containing protein [Gemmataceae bacterium]|nr:alpha-amylase/4-alpha-glucanotransferase domain-containing protein [Gemmataceae bacterium]